MFSSLADLSLLDPSFFVSQMISSEINERTRALHLGICHYEKKEVDKNEAVRIVAIEQIIN